jgi:hypothetical protein
LKEWNVTFEVPPEKFAESVELQRAREAFERMVSRRHLFDEEVIQGYRARIEEGERQLNSINSRVSMMLPEYRNIVLASEELGKRVKDFNEDDARYRQACEPYHDKDLASMCWNWASRLRAEAQRNAKSGRALIERYERQQKQFEEGPKAELERFNRDYAKPLLENIQETWRNAGTGPAKIIQLSGEMVKLLPNHEEVPVKVGDALEANVTYRVKGRSTAIIRYPSGARVLLDEGSEYTSEETPDSLTLNLHSGRLHYLKEDLKKAVEEVLPKRFKIIGPRGSGSTRGTEFLFEVKPDGSEELLVLDGIVEYQRRDGTESRTLYESEQLISRESGLEVKEVNISSIERWWEKDKRAASQTPSTQPSEETLGVPKTIKAMIIITAAAMLLIFYRVTLGD